MDNKKKLIIIAAISRDYSLGNNNDLLFHISEDMKYFKEKTTNNIVVMGRKTYESIGKALPNRINIVLTRNKDYKLKDAFVVNTKEELYNFINKEEFMHKLVFIIGGGEIYNQFIKDCTYIILTEVRSDKTGNIKFPRFKNKFRVIDSSLVKYDEKSNLNYVRNTYKRHYFGKY